MLEAKGLTFHALYDAYDKLLAANPGKALMLGNDSVLYLEGVELLSAPVRDGVVVVEEAGCIDPRAWSDSEGCWQCDDDSEMTVAPVNSPRWIDLDFIESNEHLKRQPAQIAQHQ
jgi:hypothetical protein